MRYQLEIEIPAQRERVTALFLDADNLKKWQPSLMRYEVIGGGAFRGVGAQSKQLHTMGNREIEMLATITVDNAPEEFSATFEADDVWNLVENRFAEIDNGRTRWTLTSDFRSSKWWMKALMLFFPGMFKKQTREFMDNFKAYVEAGAD